MTAEPVGWRAALGLCTLAGRGVLVVHLGLVLLQGSLPLAGLFAMQWLVDAVADGLSQRVDAAVAWQLATQAVLLAAGVAFAGNLLRALAAVVAETHGRRLADACTSRLQEHAASRDLAEYDRSTFHDLLHRAGTEASQRPVRLVQDLSAFGTALTGVLLMAAVLARVEPWLPILVGCAAVPIAWSRRRHARLRFTWHEQTTSTQRDIGYLGAALTGRATAKDVRTLRLLPGFVERLDRLRGNVRASLRRLAFLRARDELLVHTIASLALFGAYLYLGHVALTGGLSIGGLVLHAQAVQRAQNGVRDLLGAWSGTAEDRLFLRPLVTLLALPARLAAEPPVVEVAPGPIELQAESLGFQYPDSPQPVLEDVSFRIGRGERVAIVGANGSGKSTLVKLLCRLYDPTTGSVLANGTDLRHLQPECWRARIACLLQDANSFELTIGENLRLGHGPGAAVDDDALWRALEATGLAARVRALPLQLATPVSRRLAGGVEWSGGEVRRLLLARALAQPADVLLLDEPFALLDGAAAQVLAAELTARGRQRTVVVVDHRAAAVRWVDRVLVLDRGRLVAEGRPDDLAGREPRFRALFPDW